MDSQQAKNRVEVTDREGWRKEYALNKAILHIGSDSRNDVVLEATRGAGIEARHAQLIAADGGRLSSRQPRAEPDLAAGQQAQVPPRNAADLFDGDVMQIGEHTFRFFITAGASQAIGLSFRLSDTELTVDAQIEGIVTVQNLAVRRVCSSVERRRPWPRLV
ncbi:MAG: FHA domain-containing protein [Caldilineaceae bacterium]